MVRIFSLPSCSFLIQDKIDSFLKSKNAADRVIHYIRLSSEQPVGRWRSFLIIVRATWNAVKSIFGHSAWQRAIHVIENQIYVTYSQEVNFVDRTLLRVAAEKFLNRLVQDNIEGKEYAKDLMKRRHEEQMETKRAFVKGSEFLFKPIDCLKQSKDVADTIQYCLNRHIQKLGETEEFIIVVVKEVWNSVKWIFGYSAWQLAVDAIEGQVYSHWMLEQNCVDRAMLRNTSEIFLQKLVQQAQSRDVSLVKQQQVELQNEYGTVEYSLYHEAKKRKDLSPKKTPWNLNESYDDLLEKFKSPKKIKQDKVIANKLNFLDLENKN